MNILFIGTGAADWKIENRVEGEFFRRFTGNLVNDDMVIDPGPHIYDYMEKENCPELLDNVKYVLISHSHSDHCSNETLSRMLTRCPDLHIWCNETTANKISAVTSNYTVVKVGEIYEIGAYTVQPLNANHSVLIRGERPLVYSFEYEGKRVFYGLDSGWLPSDTWLTIRGFTYDCMILEVTLGDVEGDYRIFEHNNIPMVEMMMKTFRKRKILKDDGVAIGTHLAKGTHLPHEDTARRLAEFGMLTAYDGFEIAF